MADQREASLLGRITDIVHARYSKKDFYGTDVSALDVKGLHESAQTFVKPSRAPRVFLLMRNKFQAAGCAVMLRNFGCSVTVCFDGREAYVRHLKRNASRYDAALLEWDQPDINGRDIVTYCREDGSNLLFIALVSNEVLPGQAIRGGANLFLRMPLCIHMHVVRRLLLPAEITATGFPTHVLSSKSRYHDLASILGAVKLRPDAATAALLDELGHVLESDGDEDEQYAVVEGIVDNLRRVIAKADGVRGASDAQVERLQDVVRRVVTIAKDVRVSMVTVGAESRALRSQLKECTVLHQYSPILAVSTSEQLESMAKAELRDRVSKLERQQLVHLEDIERLADDLQAVSTMNLKLEESLGILQPGDMPLVRAVASHDSRRGTAVPQARGTGTASTLRRESTKGSGAGMLSRSQYMSVKDLRMSINQARRVRVPKPKLPMEVAEHLERQLMEREDKFASFRPSCDPVPISIAWDMSRAVDLQPVYDPVAKILSSASGMLNRLFSRLLATYPKARQRLLEFSREFQALFTESTPASVFAASRITGAPTPGSPSAPKGGPASEGASPLKAAAQMVELRSRLHSTHTQLSRNLRLSTDRGHQMHFFFKWRLFRIMRRGFVTNAEEERLAKFSRRQSTLRPEKESREMKLMLTEARSKNAGLEQELALAQATISEMQAASDAAWVPPPAPSMAKTDLEHNWCQTDPVSMAPAGVDVPWYRFRELGAVAEGDEMRSPKSRKGKSAQSTQRADMDLMPPSSAQLKGGSIAFEVPQEVELRVAAQADGKKAQKGAKATKSAGRGATAVNRDRSGERAASTTASTSKRGPTKKGGVGRSRSSSVGPATAAPEQATQPSASSFDAVRMRARVVTLEADLCDATAEIERLRATIRRMEGNAADSAPVDSSGSGHRDEAPRLENSSEIEAVAAAQQRHPSNSSTPHHHIASDPPPPEAQPPSSATCVPQPEPSRLPEGSHDNGGAEVHAPHGETAQALRAGTLSPSAAAIAPAPATHRQSVSSLPDDSNGNVVGSDVAIRGITEQDENSRTGAETPCAASAPRELTSRVTESRDSQDDGHASGLSVAAAADSARLSPDVSSNGMVMPAVAESRSVGSSEQVPAVGSSTPCGTASPTAKPVEDLVTDAKLCVPYGGLEAPVSRAPAGPTLSTNEDGQRANETPRSRALPQVSDAACVLERKSAQASPGTTNIFLARPRTPPTTKDEGPAGADSARADARAASGSLSFLAMVSGVSDHSPAARPDTAEVAKSPVAGPSRGPSRKGSQSSAAALTADGLKTEHPADETGLPGASHSDPVPPSIITEGVGDGAERDNADTVSSGSMVPPRMAPSSPSTTPKQAGAPARRPIARSPRKLPGATKAAVAPDASPKGQGVALAVSPSTSASQRPSTGTSDVPPLPTADGDRRPEPPSTAEPSPLKARSVGQRSQPTTPRAVTGQKQPMLPVAPAVPASAREPLSPLAIGGGAVGANTARAERRTSDQHERRDGVLPPVHARARVPPRQHAEPQVYDSKGGGLGITAQRSVKPSPVTQPSASPKAQSTPRDAAMLPPLPGPTSPQVSGSQPKHQAASAKDAKKLFAKLGIGQMPRVNPKPQQLQPGFALGSK